MTVRTGRTCLFSQATSVDGRTHFDCFVTGPYLPSMSRVCALHALKQPADAGVEALGQVFADAPGQAEGLRVGHGLVLGEVLLEVAVRRVLVAHDGRLGRDEPLGQRHHRLGGLTEGHSDARAHATAALGDATLAHHQDDAAVGRLALLLVPLDGLGRFLDFPGLGVRLIVGSS